MKKGFTWVVLAVSFTAARLAGAQPLEATPSYHVAERPQGPRTAPKNALELSAGTGYTQGFGSVKSGVGLPSVVTPGLALDLGIGYRIDPTWAVLWSGQYAELTAERSGSARAFTTSIAVQYHFAPMQRVDPWLEGGAGYRFLVEEPISGPALLTHGFQLFRARAGIDFRIEESLAVGPMIGADANMFLFQDIPNMPTSISDPRVSTFIFAGLQGRFDIRGKKSMRSPETTASAR